RVAFFFQAEDGIRVFHVTGVQTCALPIWCTVGTWVDAVAGPGRNNHPPTPGVGQCAPGTASRTSGPLGRTALPSTGRGTENCPRSEEHTSELQSRENLVCRLLLEKKKEAT